MATLANISRSRRTAEAPVFSGLVVGPIIDNPIEQYKVVITFMENDADGWPTQTITFNKGEEADLTDMMNFLARCSVAYPRGKGGYDNYKHVEGYERWVVDEDFSEEEQKDACIEWAYWDYEFCCCFESVLVTYFDENGVEREVCFKI